ncbi:MAG TPA: hypothetical protein VML54_08760 [Candidatus Limnocylindrales bacterium]|nr:hypothetical protein [Candidatus Limnocylindrales bacterium]
MNFDFSEDQKVLRDQARKFLGERASPARVRTILETDAPSDVDLWLLGLPADIRVDKDPPFDELPGGRS